MNAVWRVHWNEAREREHFGRNNILRSTSKWISSVMCNWNGWEMVKRCFWFRLLCRKRPFSLLVVWLTVLYYAESTLEISVRAFFAERCHIFVFIRFVGLWFGLVRVLSLVWCAYIPTVVFVRSFTQWLDIYFGMGHSNRSKHGIISHVWPYGRPLWFHFRFNYTLHVFIRLFDHRKHIYIHCTHRKTNVRKIIRVWFSGIYGQGVISRLLIKNKTKKIIETYTHTR